MEYPPLGQVAGLLLVFFAFLPSLLLSRGLRSEAVLFAIGLASVTALLAFFFLPRGT